jgi:hypothetical protein
MGLFSNPLGHAGYPPRVTGTPQTQSSEVRAATVAEVAAGIIDYAYISPATLTGFVANDFSKPPPLGNVTPNAVFATTLTTNGTALINSGTNAFVTTINGGTNTGALNLGNAIGNTFVTGSLTASNNLVVTTGDLTVSGGSIDVTLGNITLAAGNFTATAGNFTATAGSVSAGTTVTAGTSITAASGDITATNGNLVATAAGKGIKFTNSPSNSGAAANPLIVNGRSGQATFTSFSLAAAADITLTITNSAITGAGTQIIYSLTGATTGSALSIKRVTNSAGSSAIIVTNGTGASTSTENVVLDFIVLN